MTKTISDKSFMVWKLLTLYQCLVVLYRKCLSVGFWSVFYNPLKTWIVWKKWWKQFCNGLILPIRPCGYSCTQLTHRNLLILRVVIWTRFGGNCFAWNHSNRPFSHLNLFYLQKPIFILPPIFLAPKKLFIFKVIYTLFYLQL